jgi:hypothetical protein
MLVDGKDAGRVAEGMAARSRGMVRMMTRKSELEESGVWQTLGKKKRLEPGKLGKKKKNLHTYTHIRIDRYIQVGTMGRRPGV